MFRAFPTPSSSLLVGGFHGDSAERNRVINRRDFGLVDAGLVQVSTALVLCAFLKIVNLDTIQTALDKEFNE